jgi:large subunit ribosomal protein L9
MQVILLADVEKLGLRGDVVDVARGYARNYLLPRRLAATATPARVAELRKREERRALQEARTVEQADQIADILGKTVLRFEVKAGPGGSLFGSVTATDVADELWRVRKIRVDRRKIELHEPIKRIGRYELPIEVFGDVRVEVKTLVVPEGGELPPESEEEPVEPVAEAAVDGPVEATDADEPEGEPADVTTR